MSNTQDQLRLYSRPDCHLCDEAASLLERLGFGFVRVDITSDPRLEARYGDAIPVITWSDQEIVRAPITERGLRDALRSQLRSAS
jgi:glutaredoxin